MDSAGFEPTASALQGQRSPAELRAQKSWGYEKDRW
jgi:hypothetical protein